MKKIKKIIRRINTPLIVFLLLVGGLLIVANIKSEPIKKAKETVNSTVNKISIKLNEAAQSDQQDM